MESTEREKRFVNFVGTLFELYPQCFGYDHDIWTEQCGGEDGVLAVYIRTLIWNEAASKQVFQQLGGYVQLQKRLLKSNRKDFDAWVDGLVQGVAFGGDGGGSHRDNRHKKHTARALREYLNLTERSQVRFFGNINSFDALFNQVRGIFSIGSLTAIDFLERLIRSKHHFVKVHPDRFYLTGGGVRRSLLMIYSGSREKELQERGNKLLKKISTETNIPRDIAYFEIESILCICQKNRLRNNYVKMLKGEIRANRFAKMYARAYHGACEKLFPSKSSC